MSSQYPEFLTITQAQGRQGRENELDLHRRLEMEPMRNEKIRICYLNNVLIFIIYTGEYTVP